VELVRLLDNTVLLELMNSLCARSSLMIAVFDKPVRNNGSYEEHKEILDLLSEGKRARVCKMMRRHLGGCQERLNQLRLRFFVDKCEAAGVDGLFIPILKNNLTK
jgi:DNA-binding GntR family transcriptional regulator